MRRRHAWLHDIRAGGAVRQCTTLEALFGLVFVIFTSPRIPLLTFALTFVAISGIRAAHEALKEDFDARSGFARKNSEALAELKAGHGERAAAIARAALENARSLAQRRKLWTTLAWSGVHQKDPFLTHFALEHLPPSEIDLHLLAAYLVCCNRGPEAEELLRDARVAGHRSQETCKQLIELSFARGDHSAVRALATADADLLSAAERSAIAQVLAADEACAEREQLQSSM